MFDVAIVGAGIGGLSLAYYLSKAGISVCIIEASTHVGGAIQSLSADGYLLELGPHTVISKPDFIQLVEEVGLSSIMEQKELRGLPRFIADRQSQKAPRLLPSPTGLGTAITTPILTLGGKLRLLLEPFQKSSANNDEDVYSFFSRRCGEEFASRVIATMLSGIWAANTKKLSCRTALPTIWSLEQEYGSVIKGFIQRPKPKTPTKPSSPKSIVAFPKGLSQLPQAIASLLPPSSLVLGSKTVQLKPKEHQVELTIHSTEGTRTIDAKSVVITCDTTCASALLCDIEANISQQIKAVPYAPIGIMHLGIRRQNALNPMQGFGFLCPPEQNKELMGALFSSSLFSGRSPDGTSLLTCFVGGAVNPDLCDTANPQIQNSIVNEVSQFLGIKEAPKIIHTTTNQAAIPNYPLGHRALQEGIEAYHARQKQIRILANWYRGISVPERISEAKQLAKEIISLHEDCC